MPVYAGDQLSFSNTSCIFMGNSTPSTCVPSSGSRVFEDTSVTCTCDSHPKTNCTFQVFTQSKPDAYICSLFLYPYFCSWSLIIITYSISSCSSACRIEDIYKSCVLYLLQLPRNDNNFVILGRSGVNYKFIVVLWPSDSTCVRSSSNIHLRLYLTYMLYPTCVCSYPKLTKQYLRRGN